MKIFVASCFDGREPWPLRQKAARELVDFDELLRAKGFEVVNFASPCVDPESTESCIAFADTVVTFRGHTMCGTSENIRSLARKRKKPIFEFVFRDSGYALRDFTLGREFSWPEIQQVAISDYEEVFSRLTAMEIHFAQAAL